MTELLRLDVSARGTDSVSRTVTDTFERTWRERTPHAEVTTRDLAESAVPHLPAEVVPRSTGQVVETDAARFQDSLVDELVRADAVVISTPMYNLGIPSVLKAWIDHVILLGRTLRFHGEPPPTAGTPMTVITTFGGGYGPGAPREGWDHLRPYLRTVFEGMLRMDVEFVTVEYTLAATTPGMEDLVEMGARALRLGHETASRRAAGVAASLATGGLADLAAS
ncbi:NAD(P)H-dependent oxidoreductase [Phycicoccus sp. BSK3Z-2]|uniref:FMN dependent NADH:quinone oxidoreductase n=1 Tax=Phycicoccus avicenniae TaxID=2828860 RepID=A0A941D4C1_9MICO|nr:NAD(P)H-dependent oxidoreductase [Phycicoccus avicenniae]MBR7741864.1 NAD(P)H-dependent oxidoreductase [Phycicoccus avicenniae]